MWVLRLRHSNLGGLLCVLPSAGEEVRAEFFMEELNNGVKLCKLIGALQAKVAQSCPSALCKVSRAAVMSDLPRARFHPVMYYSFKFPIAAHTM